MRVGRTVENTLKRCETEQKGGSTKILKRGGQAVSRGGCLKKGGDWNPLRNMDNTLKNVENKLFTKSGCLLCTYQFTIIQLQKYVVLSMLSGYSMCNLRN